MYAPPSTIAIGEIDQTIFECPSCSRPLALGARRCPGCRTRLIGGVTLGKASGFIAVGLAVGLLAGAGGGIVFGFSHATAPPPVAAVGGPGTPAGGSNPAGAGPTATPTGTPTPTASPESNIPPLARSALTQAVATNDRLATAKAGLKAALAAPTFDASSVAQILRGVSADSLYGEQLAGYVATWSAAGDAATTLSTFYGTTHDLAANGLLASVRNASAYRSAARAMIKQLDGLPALDAAMRSAAQSAGFELPAASG